MEVKGGRGCRRGAEGSARAVAARITASCEEGKLTRRLTKGANAPGRRHKATHSGRESDSRVARQPPGGDSENAVKSSSRSHTHTRTHTAR